MDEKMRQAWQLFSEGQVAQAKKLVAADFNLLTCEDDQLLNFMGYVKLVEQDYEGAIQIYQRLLTVAKKQVRQRIRAYCLASIGDGVS